MPQPSADPMQRFIRFVEKQDGHWMWTGKQAGGDYAYGQFRSTTRASDAHVYAHRWIYEQVVGPIPGGYEVDHKCRIRLCVKPAHLEAVTQEENNRRKRLDVCRSGRHDLTVVENARWDEQGRRRGCLVCYRERARDRSRRLYEPIKAANRSKKEGVSNRV